MPRNHLYGGSRTLSSEHHGSPDRLSAAEYVNALKLQSLNVSPTNAWWTLWPWRYRRSELCSSLQIDRGTTEVCKRTVKMAPRPHVAARPQLDEAFQTTVVSKSGASITSLIRLHTYQIGFDPAYDIRNGD